MNLRTTQQRLLIPTLALVAVAVFFIIYAPVDRTLGLSQKIFYPHVGLAWVMMVAFFVNFVGGIGYLAKEKDHWDRLAASSAEIGVVFCALVLLSGAVWGRIAWGVWWLWDVRLTTTLILLLAYAGYLLVRTMAKGQKKKTFSAVIGVMAFADVPLVFISIRWWRSIHPAVITPEGIHLDGTMKIAMFASLGAMSLLYATWLVSRIRAKRSEARGMAKTHRILPASHGD